MNEHERTREAVQALLRKKHLDESQLMWRCAFYDDGTYHRVGQFMCFNAAAAWLIRWGYLPF